LGCLSVLFSSDNKGHYFKSLLSQKTVELLTNTEMSMGQGMFVACVINGKVATDKI
jgi:hypothetical protein